MLKDLAALIVRHTVPSRRHLTPELVLRLVTPACALWRAREGQGPFEDPYWAFYWPGGQAAARYILDNGEIVRNRRVLDIGCGCGAGSIAAAKMNATHVLANDIDPYAVAATIINAELNDVTVETSTDDLITQTLLQTTLGSKLEHFDTILVGDMFYDEEFSGFLFDWLQRLAAEGRTVLIGDPGRLGLAARRRSALTPLARYEMPRQSCEENHGFTHTTLWQLNKP